MKPQFVLLIIGLFTAAYFGNIYKLTQCDFEAPVRCEVLHGIGLIPILAPVMVFADSDS